MSVFIDTGVPVALHNVRDVNHDRATGILEEVKDGRHGTPYSSDFILDEAVTLARARTKNLAIARTVGRFFIPEEGELQLLVLVHVDSETVRRAWDAYRRHDTPLSFTDWTLVEQVRQLGIDRVASFDSRLDAWVSRIA